MGEIRNIEIKIDKKHVLRRLGNKLDKKVRLLIDQEIGKAHSLVEPYAVFKDLEIEFVKEDRIQLKNAFLIKCKNLAKILRTADKATLIAVTIGDNLEKPVDSLTDNIRFAIGSEAAEYLAVAVNKIITKRAKLKGYKTLFRFSVGYGGWELKDQKKIFDLLKPKKIRLGNDYKMHPIKSITALIGWEKE